MSLEYDRDSIENLIRQAEQLELGLAKAILLEEAIRLTDLHGTDRERVNIRWKHSFTILHCGREDHFILLFTQMLALIDLDPPRYNQAALVSYFYPVALAFACSLSELPLEQIKSLLADFEQRADNLGCSKRLVQFNRVRQLVWCGADLQVTWREYERYLNFPVDKFTEDFKHYLEREAYLLEEMGDELGAISRFQQVDPSNPHLLRLYWRHGQYEKLQPIFLSSLQAIRKRNDSRFMVSFHLWFAGVSHNWRIGKRLLEVFWARHASSQCADTRFSYYARAAVFLQCWIQFGPERVKTIRINSIPDGLMLARTNPQTNLIDANELLQACQNEAKHIADKYDRRNKSSRYASKLKEFACDVLYSRSFPLSTK